MKRSEFLRNIAVTMGVATVTPMALIAKNDPVVKDKTSRALDMEAISHFTMGGNNLTPTEVINLWRQTGVLVYSSRFGNCPYLFNGTVEVIDLNG